MPYTWKAVEERLKKEDGYRLPTIGEAIIMNFDHTNIWVSDMINDKHLVMDREWGARIISDDGIAGLILSHYLLINFLSRHLL